MGPLDGFHNFKINKVKFAVNLKGAHILKSTTHTRTCYYVWSLIH